MVRVDFIIDRNFCKFGLSGKSFISMLMNYGCGDLEIMASRMIESNRKMEIVHFCPYWGPGYMDFYTAWLGIDERGLLMGKGILAELSLRKVNCLEV